MLQSYYSSSNALFDWDLFNHPICARHPGLVEEIRLEVQRLEARDRRGSVADDETSQGRRDGKEGMKPSYRILLGQVLIAFKILGLFGCNKEEDQSDAQPDAVVETGGDGGFDKPPIRHDDRCNAPIESDGPIGGLSSTALCPRRFMNPTDDFLEAWAYEDEAAIFDISTQVNREVLEDQYVSSGTYYFYILVDFKPVPFGLVPVNAETGFPAREDIPADIETHKRATFELGNHNRKAVTDRQTSFLST